MHLEMHMRGASGAREHKSTNEGYDHPSICGRDQVALLRNRGNRKGEKQMNVVDEERPEHAQKSLE